MTFGPTRDYRGIFFCVAIVAFAYLAWFVWLFQRGRASPYLAGHGRPHLELASTKFGARTRVGPRVLRVRR